MGTRSTYRIRESYKSEDGKVKFQNLGLVYVQYDGYPDGHPLDTAEWLASGTVVNGIGMDDDKRLVFNGAGCLAAQMVARMKKGAGGVYLNPLSSRGKSWEDYLYDIVVDEDRKITFIAYSNGKRPYKIFEGTPEEFVKKYQKEPVTS